VFLELICKLKAPICELEFALSTKRVIGLIGTKESRPMIVDVEESTKTKENDAALDSGTNKTECVARHVLQRDQRNLSALVLRVEAAWCRYLWLIIDSGKG